MTRVKICGITNPFDARLAVHAGADAIGLVFAESPRRVSVSAAREVVEVVAPFVEIVAVFMDAAIEGVRDICDELGVRTVQLHGFESPEYIRQLHRSFTVIKACELQASSDIDSLAAYEADAYLIDSRSDEGRGGTGRTCDWELTRQAAAAHVVVLAGGLSPENVADAVRSVRPYAVDASTGLEEAPGKKDPEKMRLFVERVRRTDLGQSPPPEDAIPGDRR